MNPLRAFSVFVLLTFFSIPCVRAEDGDLIPHPESEYKQHIDIVNQQMDQAEGLTTAAAGQETPPVQKAPLQTFTPMAKARFNRSDLSFEIAPEVSSITYREPSVHVKESGVMSGINGIFTYRPPEGSALNSEISNMYRVEGRFDYGKVTYNGALVYSDGTTVPYTHHGISDFMLEFRGLIGKDLFFNERATTVTPYWGGGYRHLFDAFYTAKPGGYNRRIQYIYIPTGVDVMTKIGNGWSIGANAEYDFFINGHVTSYLGNIGLGNLNNTQKHGFGVRGSIKLIKKLDHANLIFEPYIRYWHIRNSNVQPSDPFSFDGKQYVFVGYEPNNNSTEIGGKLGVEF